MPGIRVHELAKELNLSSRDTIALLDKVGIRASTHMSLIDEHRARIVKGVLTGNLAQVAKTKPKRTPAVAGNGAAAAPKAPPKIATAAPAANAARAQTVEEVKPQPPAAPEEPTPRLRPVPAGQKSAVPAPPRQAPAHHKVVPAASALRSRMAAVWALQWFASAP